LAPVQWVENRDLGFPWVLPGAEPGNHTISPTPLRPCWPGNCAATSTARSSAFLATCRWIEEHHNVLVTGATGVGKTYVACALGQQACRHGYRTIYRRLPRLFEEFTLAHADGSYTAVLTRFARVDVLVLDDWGLAAITDRHRRDLLEVIDDRDGARSTVSTSQLEREHWHDYLGDPMIADAILDRLVHRAHAIKLKGPSKRPPETTRAAGT
jgi:DNA replication protein DnaC